MAVIMDSGCLRQEVETLVRGPSSSALGFLYRQPLLVAAAYLIILLATGIFNAVLFGHWTSTPTVTGLSEDSVFWYGAFVLAISVYYYLMVPTWLGRAFESLYAHNVFVVPEVKIDRNTQQLFASRYLISLPFVFTLVVIAIWTTTAQLNPHKMWWEAEDFSFISLTVVEIFSWFAIAGVILEFCFPQN